MKNISTKMFVSRVIVGATEVRSSPVVVMPEVSAASARVSNVVWSSLKESVQLSGDQRTL